MSAKDLRTQLLELVTRSEAITTRWEGKEGGEGFDESMKELREILGQADVVRTRLDMAMRQETLQKSLRDSGTAGAGVIMERDTVPGEGVLTEYQMEMVARPEYKGAYESYLRARTMDDVGPADRKILVGGKDDTGGFTIPEDWINEMAKKAAARPSIRQNAKVSRTSRDSVRVPKVVYAGTGAKLYTSGVRMKWVGEEPATSTVHRVTDPVFGSDLIPVHTAMASLPITLDLLEDSAFNLEQYIVALMEEGFSLGEEDVFWNGTGVGQPQGLLAHPMATTADSETTDGMFVISGDAALLTADGLIDLAFALPEQYDANAKWYFNKRSTEKAIRKLKAGGTNDYLWPVVTQVGGFGAHGGELLGYPVVRSPFAPNIAAGAYPIAFGDMSAYSIVDRVGLSIQRLNEIYAETNIVVFLARKRLGGKLVEPYRLKLQKISA